MDLKWLGSSFDPQDLIAGFAGGVAHVFAFKQTQPWAQVGSVVCGTLAANFLTPFITKTYPNLGAGGAAFLIGISAMAFIRRFVALVSIWLNGLGVRGERKP